MKMSTKIDIGCSIEMSTKVVMHAHTHTHTHMHPYLHACNKCTRTFTLTGSVEARQTDTADANAADTWNKINSRLMLPFIIVYSEVALSHSHYSIDVCHIQIVHTHTQSHACTHANTHSQYTTGMLIDLMYCILKPHLVANYMPF